MMTAATTATDERMLDTSAAADSVADVLNAQGFEVRIPTSEQCCHLKVTSVRSVVADLTIARSGTAAWDYHSYDGSPPDPDRITTIVLMLLNDHDRPSGSSGAGLFPCMTLLGSIGRAAIGHGLSVAFGLLNPDEQFPRINNLITITNPDRPHRGTVRVADDGGIRWNCHVRDHPPGTGGLDLTDIAATIARAITNPPVLSIWTSAGEPPGDVAGNVSRCAAATGRRAGSLTH